MLNIRAMEEKDIPQVEEIEKKIFSLPWSEKSFHDACSDENNIYLVCEDEGTIAGYCGLWTVFGEGNITNMAVHPDYRKRYRNDAYGRDGKTWNTEKSRCVFSGSA